MLGAMNFQSLGEKSAFSSGEQGSSEAGDACREPLDRYAGGLRRNVVSLPPFPAAALCRHG